MISIFDTGPGPGMDVHRSDKEQATSGSLYLKPLFEMFGYGRPIASMKLGRHALVSSKTRDSEKVYTLNLARDALLGGSNWKTSASMRDPYEDEVSKAPHGSFTKVEISEHISTLDISELQCKLKDIYFPYIQTDLAHNSPFTTALRNFGNENEKDMIVQIDRDGTLLDHSQLKRDYENWILQMHDQYDDEDQPGGFVGAAPRIMKTIGTTNVLYHTKEEFFAGADTRETFETASNMYIVTDKCIKCQEFKKSIFVTFNGDVPIGREILSHLKRKLDLQKNKNRTVTVSQLAEEAYNCNTIFEGKCTVYIGGLQEGAPALHVLKVNINRESGTLDKRLERQKLTKSQELLVDGHGGPVAEKIWEEHKGYLSYTSGQIRILVIQSLVSSALVSKATGGSLSYCHFYTIGGVTDATVETRTVKAWYEAVYDSFPTNWHDRNVFSFFDKNKLHDDYFARWIRQLGVKGFKHLNIGSTIGKVHRKKNLFFVQGETTRALRSAILAQGVENTKVFPKLKSHMGIQGLREYNFEGETFYVAGSSQGLLENMQLDLNIDESNIIPGPARLHEKYIENPL